MRSKLFISHLIFTLRWYLTKRIRSRSEKFTPSYNHFFYVVQITIQDTARIARNTTRFSPLHERSTFSTTWPTSSSTVWDWCKPSITRIDPKTCKPARSGKKVCTVVSFTPLLHQGQSGISVRPVLEAQSQRGNTFRASHQVSDNSELFKKPEPSA